MGKEPRSPERITPILEKIKEAWTLYPDMRLGQLLAACTMSANISGVEDDEMLKGIEKYIDSMKKALGIYSGVKEAETE